jgi:diketogulonate reductase-like aldo/keto reductase
MRLTAVKSRDLVSAIERVTDLIRSGESGAAKYENAKWLHGFLGEQRSRSYGEGKCAGGGSGEFDEMATCRSLHCSCNSCVIPREVEESLIVPTSLGMTMDKANQITRREATKLIGASAAGLLLPVRASRAQSKSESSTMLTRPIPSSGEKLPVIGLGTWQKFDVDLTSDNRRQLGNVLSSFVRLGGRVIDTSPMYGRAEEVIGDLTTTLGIRDKLFLATKVWTRGQENGIRSMERSMVRLRTKQIDLMQVHNLVDVRTHLATLRQWKEQGRIRYIGITHYESGAFAEVEKIMRNEKLDFVQINYSIMEREAEERVLPLAQERGIAVIINRPFGGGDLFDRVRSKSLPEWSAEFDCRSWAQFFVKWIIANPAVTCVIPATDKPRHLEDNMEGGIGPLPDQKVRQRMVEVVSSF